MNRTRVLTLTAVAAAATSLLTGCRIVPGSPGFDVPNGSAVWFLDVDTDDDGDGRTDRTVRGVWTFCLGTPEQPKPCGTTPDHSWREIGTVRR